MPRRIVFGCFPAPGLRRLGQGAAALALAAALAGCQYLPGHRNAVQASAPLRMVKLDATVLNLADTAQPAYLRIGVTLGLASPAAKDGDAESESVARDTVVALASKETSDVLLSASGKDDLKKALLAELRQRLPAADVEELYFDEFLVQR